MTKQNTMIEKADQILILSGEGETGSFEIYTGKRTDRAMKTKLTKERCNGARFAFALVSAGEGYAEDTYIELDHNLEPDGYRTVRSEDI